MGNRKRNHEGYMSLEERRARKLKLTRIKESAALLRARKHDRNAINRALSHLTRTEEWIASTSQEERIEAIRDERKYVLASRFAKRISEKALFMKFMKRRPIVEQSKNEDEEDRDERECRLNEQSRLEEDLKEEELNEIEQVLKESEEYGLEYLEMQLQELQQEEMGEEDEEDEELHDLKELELDESEEEPPVGKWETALEKLDKGLKEPNRKELREEIQAEKVDKMDFDHQFKKDLRGLRSRRALEKGKSKQIMAIDADTDADADVEMDVDTLAETKPKPKPKSNPKAENPPKRRRRVNPDSDSDLDPHINTNPEPKRRAPTAKFFASKALPGQYINLTNSS